MSYSLYSTALNCAKMLFVFMFCSETLLINDNVSALERLRKSKFLSKTLLTFYKYRYLSRIKRVLNKNLDLRKHTNDDVSTISTTYLHYQ